QDVYDAAEWSCIGSLTSASLEHNSMPVAVPDFTRGDWDKVDGFRHAMAQ
ncbi:MAG: glycosyl hydrolase, partial [Alistipes finegoldii]